MNQFDLSNLEFTLVDANYRAVRLLSPMFIIVKVEHAADPVQDISRWRGKLPKDAPTPKQRAAQIQQAQMAAAETERKEEAAKRQEIVVGALSRAVSQFLPPTQPQVPQIPEVEEPQVPQPEKVDLLPLIRDPDNFSEWIRKRAVDVTHSQPVDSFHNDTYEAPTPPAPTPSPAPEVPISEPPQPQVPQLPQIPHQTASLTPVGPAPEEIPDPTPPPPPVPETKSEPLVQPEPPKPETAWSKAQSLIAQGKVTRSRQRGERRPNQPRRARRTPKPPEVPKPEPSPPPPQPEVPDVASTPPEEKKVFEDFEGPLIFHPREVDGPRWSTHAEYLEREEFDKKYPVKLGIVKAHLDELRRAGYSQETLDEVQRQGYRQWVLEGGPLADLISSKRK
jgi:hypothetical protein